MKRVWIPLLLLVAGLILYGQQSRTDSSVRWEHKALLPTETSPARYTQVQEWEIKAATEQGWELVAVSPYVYLNEERGPDGRKLVVTQTYAGYYFKRPKRER
jgi:hypothetical protein